MSIIWRHIILLCSSLNISFTLRDVIKWPRCLTSLFDVLAISDSSNPSLLLLVKDFVGSENVLTEKLLYLIVGFNQRIKNREIAAFFILLSFTTLFSFVWTVLCQSCMCVSSTNDVCFTTDMTSLIDDPLKELTLSVVTQKKSEISWVTTQYVLVYPRKTSGGRLRIRLLTTLFKTLQLAWQLGRSQF